VQANLLLSNEVAGSRMQHSTDGIIEVPRPARFDEHLRFVIVNASDKFRLKPDRVLVGGPTYILEEAFFPINHDVPDFVLFVAFVAKSKYEDNWYCCAQRGGRCSLFPYCMQRRWRAARSTYAPDDGDECGADGVEYAGLGDWKP